MLGDVLGRVEKRGGGESTALATADTMNILVITASAPKNNPAQGEVIITGLPLPAVARRGA